MCLCVILLCCGAGVFPRFTDKSLGSLVPPSLSACLSLSEMAEMTGTARGVNDGQGYKGGARAHWYEGERGEMTGAMAATARATPSRSRRDGCPTLIASSGH